MQIRRGWNELFNFKIREKKKNNLELSFRSEGKTKTYNQTKTERIHHQQTCPEIYVSFSGRIFKLPHIALISHASKVMLKILQAGLQQYVNHELPDVQAEIEKAEEPEIKLPTPIGSLKKQEGSRKTSISALLTIPKFWLCGSQQTV